MEAVSELENVRGVYTQETGFMGTRVKGSGLVLVGLQREPGVPQLLTGALGPFQPILSAALFVS